MTLWAGLGGATRNGCAALCTEGEVIGICGQERITRVRSAGFNSTGLPDEALQELLVRAGRTPGEIASYAIAETVSSDTPSAFVHLDHHFAHACSSFLSSPFETATIVICDHEAPEVTVWKGAGGVISRVECPWQGPGFATLYSRCAETLGFAASAGDQRMEALARFDAPHRDPRADRLFALRGGRLECTSDWRPTVETWLGAGGHHEQAARIAAALQSRMGDLLIEFLQEVARITPAAASVCLGGSLFYNSHFNSRVKGSGIFDAVYVPVDPGNAGLAVGAALQVSGSARRYVSPFLGPSYSPQESKETLENCKLEYAWLSETDSITMAVDRLRQGQLVAWFDGAMEWGPRALGGRSILANPFAPYVLENLNRFLKQRRPWRGYALSGLAAAVAEHFNGPAASPFMECDYAPKEPERFRLILPGPGAAVRVQTVGEQAPPRFQALLQAFGEATGIPVLANTSFNGFREPMVCSPRDAVRVFFGTGTDFLQLDRFAISK